MTGRTTLAPLIVLVLAAGCGDRVPPTIVVEDVALDLLGDAAHTVVLAPPAGTAIALAPITPGEWIRGDGPRPALTMPAPSTVRFQVPVTPDAVLRFGAGVGNVKRREENRSGVRFTVRIDGAERWTRTIDPARTRHDRRWFDEQIPFGGNAARTAVVELEVAADDPRHPVAGVPGWSRVDIATRHSYPRQRASAHTPNVLVLLVDTLRADCVGGTPTLTPNLDALGARGLVFEQAIAQSSWTLQSVPSIMTGLIPHSHGVRGNFWNDPADDDAAGDHLPNELETFAEAAARTGTTTVAVSANPLVSRATNLSQGFETFDEFGWDREHKQFAAANDVNATFLAWLRTHRDLRFLAYLHYMDVHDPYTPPAGTRPAPPPDLPPVLANGWILETARKINFHGAPKLPATQVEYLRHLYQEEVRAFDATLPALLDGLRDAGVLDSTIIIVTADHGEEFQEHGFLKHGQSLHAELVRVPLLMAGPGIPTGRRPQQVQGIDLYPTLAQLLDFPTHAAIHGRDLVAPLDGDATVISETAHAVGDGGATVDSIALRTPEWTLLAHPASRRYVLFHRPDDPQEHHDRFATDAAAAPLVAELDHRLAAAPPAPHSAAVASDVHERLRTLGYAD